MNIAQNIRNRALGADAAASRINLAWVGRIIRDRWHVVAGASAATLILSLLYLLVATPKYVATTWLIVDDQRPRVLNSQEILQSMRFDLGLPMLQQLVESQIAVIKSQAVAEKVMQQFNGLDWRRRPGSEETFAEEDIERFLNRLTVRRMGSSFIIQVSYTDRNPKRAADVANAVAKEYIEQQVQRKTQAKLGATEWLEKRVAELKDRVRIEGNNIEAFKNKHNLVSIGQELLRERELSRMLDRVVESRAEAANAVARLKQAEQVVKDPERVDGVASSIQSPLITELRRQQSVLTSKLAFTISRMGETHPDVRTIRAEIADVNKSITRELGRMIETLRNEAKIASSRASLQSAEVDALQNNMVKGSHDIVALKELELDNRTTRELFVALSTRLKESQLQASLDNAEARIVNDARPPETQSWPRIPVVVLLGILSGLIGATALLLIQEFAQGIIRSPADVAAATSLSLVASLPLAGPEPRPSRWQTAVWKELFPTSPAKADVVRVGRYALTDLAAPYAQGLFNVVTHLEEPRRMESVHRKGRIIALASSDTGDGKTTTALNLADYMAASGRKVLLIDADCRAPTLTAALMPHPERSIAEFASATADNPPVLPIARPDGSAFDFCPGPHGRPCPSPTIVVGSPALAQRINEARDTYEYILVDTPALRDFVDARAIITLSDLVLVVVQHGRSTRARLESVIDQVAGGDDRVAGIVLNKAP